MEISKTINKNFVIIDLGSSDAKVNKFLKSYQEEITYIDIDAISNDENKSLKYYKKISINKGLHDVKGIHEFYERDYIGTSSFLIEDKEIIKSYGIEHLFNLKNKHSFDSITLSEVLSENKIEYIDFLKLDLEGLDYRILKSIENKLENVSVIMTEVRFQPLFVGESYFFEISQFLYSKGFELINIVNINEWKLKTKNQSQFRDGRIVWGDFIFFKKRDNRSQNFVANITKQILIAKSLDLNSYAEFLFESNQDLFNKELKKELSILVTKIPVMEKFFNSIFYVISRTKLIYPIRKTIKYFYTRSKIHSLFNQGI